ncbi:MAG: esterase-like activity of phytase family protein, partial [Rhodobacteraceae bacterium]|nr:esterase-like activity of phytase family protein [Paracoccaceae bacterium]
VYRFRNNVWDRLLEVPRRPPFLVVGADVFDGKLYVLERHLGGLSGFSTRIRRFSLEDTLTNEEVLLLTRAGDYDNLEGISVWRDDAGVIRTTLISDDNFNFFQQTQIAEFVLIAP